MKLRDLFTEKDNLTLDIKRVLVIPAALFTPIGAQFFAIFHGQAFSVKDMCEGLAVVVAAVAALLAGHAISNGENQ